jgi:hypothetical protein
MKQFKNLSLVFLITLFFITPELHGQRVYEFETFISKIREKKDKDQRSLGCHAFTFIQQQTIREDTVTTRIETRGAEYHSINHPLLRTYSYYAVNDVPGNLPAPDTLYRRIIPPSFYSENYSDYYKIKDLRFDELNGKKLRHLQFVPRSRKLNLMKGEVWIDPETHGIIKMTMEPYPLPHGINLLRIEIYNSYDAEGRVIRYGMHTIQNIIASDKKMEISIWERYADYIRYPDSLCVSLKSHF